MALDFLVHGTYEEARELVNRATEAATADIPVEQGQAEAFASHLEDGLSRYWDRRNPLVPPGLLMCLFVRLPWRPAPVAGGVLGSRIPLPGSTVINVSTETEFRRQLRVGDELTVTETLTDVSPLKTTKLGAGHFVTTTATYRDQHGQTVAVHRNVLFRFDPAGDTE